MAPFDWPSPKPATQILVSAAEHPADGELNDRIQHPESWFDLHIVADHAAATRVVQQGGRSQAVVAMSWVSFSDGVIHPRVCRGRWLSWRATASSCRLV